jgi:hypothetical protein
VTAAVLSGSIAAARPSGYGSAWLKKDIDMGDRKLLNIELRRVTAKEYKELPPSGIVAD